MTAEINALIITASTIAFFHTLLGPDHYLPFIMMSWARKWSRPKTCLVTLLCGLGHVASSVVLGFIGILLGLAVGNLETFESVCGSLAAWMLIAFGLMYMVWGIRRAYRNKPHTHRHIHLDAHEHAHEHKHQIEHAHVHDRKAKSNITPWALFIIFIFGPCEPLIPILMYPAAKNSLFGVFAVIVVFSVITIGTMLGIVLLAQAGINFAPLTRLQRYTHAIGGATILICGLAIHFFGI